MKLEITIKLDRVQQEFFEFIVKDIVASEVTRQLKFKRNEVLKNIADKINERAEEEMKERFRK